MGATESLLELDAWRELEAANPVLATLEPDVEALLVNRARGARRHWIVPIDDCYALVGLIRTPLARADRRRGGVGGDRPRSSTTSTGAATGEGDPDEQAQGRQADTKHDAPAHTPGHQAGQREGQLREAGRATSPTGGRPPSARRASTRKAREPIDPRMPNLSPA